MKRQADMDYSKIFAKRIKQLCKERNLSINRLASICGLRQSTIDNIIHGASKNPKIRTLHVIASSLNMTVSEFCNFKELNEYSPDDDDELITSK